MANGTVRKLTRVLRKVDGTWAEPVRNALLALVGFVSEIVFTVQRRGGRRTLHPLAAFVSRQVGEPRENWNLEDLAALRQKSVGLMAYLPSGILSRETKVHLGMNDRDGGIDSIALTPDRVLDDSRIVVYMHGGGFVLGDARSVLPEADYLAQRLGLVTYVLEYPLAPENPYPGPLLSTVGALRDLAGRYKEIMLVGESAGGNLAVSSVLRDPVIRAHTKAIVLSYAWLDLVLESSSMKEFGEGHVLTRGILDWFADQYVSGSEGMRSNVEVSPLRSASLKSLPPVLCVVGEFDPLLDDARSLVRQVSSGELVIVPGMVHGLLQFRAVYRGRIRVLEKMVNFIHDSPVQEES